MAALPRPARPQSIDEYSQALLDLAQRMDEMSATLRSLGTALGGVARVRATAAAKVDRVGGARTLAVAGGAIVVLVVARRMMHRRSGGGPRPNLEVIHGDDSDVAGADAPEQ